MKAALCIALVLSSGCDLPLAPDVRFVGRRPMVPVPTVYAMWYAEVEACLGVRGDFGAVRWHLADMVEADGARKAGVLEFPHRITMGRGLEGAPWAVKHEMVHHITRVGDALHDSRGRVPCEH